MSVVNQIKNNIKEEFANPEPSSKQIITYLSDLRIKEELSDSEFYDIVGETFKLNPEFFMNHIYPKMLYEKINKMEMEKYIIEKFCLYEGEQILYECNGKIEEKNPTLSRKPVKISIDGRIYVTNYRVIAHGKFSVSGGQIKQFDLFSWGRAQRAKGKGDLIGSSLSQELPCYGYQFNKKDLSDLHKTSTSVGYYILKDDIPDTSSVSTFKRISILAKAMNFIKINPPREQIDELYDLLFPKEDVNQIVERFRKIQVMLGKLLKRKRFSNELQALWKLKDYQYLSDSEKMEIVLGVYKLDPELFISSIYPEMNNWEFPSFLNIKSALFDLLKKEGANIN